MIAKDLEISMAAVTGPGGQVIAVNHRSSQVPGQLTEQRALAHGARPGGGRHETGLSGRRTHWNQGFMTFRKAGARGS